MNIEEISKMELDPVERNRILRNAERTALVPQGMFTLRMTQAYERMLKQKGISTSDLISLVREGLKKYNNHMPAPQGRIFEGECLWPDKVYCMAAAADILRERLGEFGLRAAVYGKPKNWFHSVCRGLRIVADELSQPRGY